MTDQTNTLHAPSVPNASHHNADEQPLGKRVIIYYQTFVGFSNALEKTHCFTHVHFSSIHFGTNNDTDKTPYIHLNDHDPDDPIFNQAWKDMEAAHVKGIRVVLMVGGAGSAFTKMFSNYKTYFDLLVDTIRNHSCITGVDLDVEEEVELDDIRMLINDLDMEFCHNSDPSKNIENFIISMAPLGESLTTDEPGMGGFCYKDLYKTPEGQRINYFNGQFYGGTFGVDCYEAAVANGYPASKVVMGMESGNYPPGIFPNALGTVRTLSKKYPDFGGVFDWEYFDAPPDLNDHSHWGVEMYKAIHKAIHTSDTEFEKKMKNLLSESTEESNKSASKTILKTCIEHPILPYRNSMVDCMEAMKYAISKYIPQWMKSMYSTQTREIDK